MKKQRSKQHGARKRTDNVTAETPDIHSYSIEEIRTKVATGESRTDWARVGALTDADIDRAIASDPDAAPLLGKWFWDTAEWVRSDADTPHTED